MGRSVVGMLYKLCLPFLICLFAGLLCSCGEKKEEVKFPQPEPEPDPLEEPVTYSLLAEDRFEYPDGSMKDLETPEGFAGKWSFKRGEGATVRNGVAKFVHPIRVSCVLDTSRAGPFIEFLDEKQMIGREGKTIYLSYYQALTNVEEDQVAIVEFVQGNRDVHFFTQFNTGTDTSPAPAGPFGLRAKRNIDMVIAAPEELNERENLIVLKIHFRYDNKDKLYYYYNPSPEDEKSPDGAIEADDLSFDRYGMACFGGATMTFRHFRIADNFKSVVVDAP